MEPANWDFVVGVWLPAATRTPGGRLGMGFLVSPTRAFAAVELDLLDPAEGKVWLRSGRVDSLGRIVRRANVSGLHLSEIVLDSPAPADVRIPDVVEWPSIRTNWESWYFPPDVSGGMPIKGVLTVSAEGGIRLQPIDAVEANAAGAPVVVGDTVLGVVSRSVGPGRWDAVPIGAVHGAFGAGVDTISFTEGAGRVLAYALPLLGQVKSGVLAAEHVLLGGLAVANLERRRGSTDALFMSLGDDRSAKLREAAAEFGAHLPETAVGPVKVMSPEAEPILRLALSYERLTTATGTVGTRHLMAAAVASVADGALLEALGRSRSDLIAALRDYLHTRRPDESPAGWAKVLGTSGGDATDPGAPLPLSGSVQDVCRLARQSGGTTGTDALVAGLLRHATLTERRDFSHLLAEAIGRTEPAGAVSGLPPLEPVYRRDFDGLMGAAHWLMRRTSSVDVVANRHLVAAVVSTDTGARLGIDVDRFWARFLDLVQRFCPDDDVDAWREALFSGPGSTPLPARAGYRPDDLGDSDELGIQDDVDMLCNVLAAKDAHPPLSVGLFGDWGTGKSFFMRQMERKVNELTAAARAASAQGKATAYCSYVVQIRFNAWSYLDTNLWANLAVGIFERLASPPLDPQDDPDAAWDKAEQARIATERTKLLSQLQTFQELRADVARERKAAQDQKDAVTKQLDELAEERKAKASELSTLQAEDVYAVLATNPGLGKVRKEAAEALGLSDVNIKDLRDLRNEVSTVGGQLSAVWRLVLKDDKAARRLTLAAVALVATPLLAWAALYLSGPARAVGPVSALASLVGAVVTFARCLRPMLDKASAGLDHLTKALGEVDRLEAEIEQKRRKKEAELVDQLKVLDIREAVLVQKDADISSRVAEAEQALNDLNQGRRLYRFLEERSASTEYRQHLGIVALIRRDFDRLTKLLRYDNPDKGDLPPIDRIIVYVDDLDRCPPERVVEVLQAVHLLLAFPIFMVVVGVDSRWLMRSLAAHIAKMLPGEDPVLGDDTERIASPQNYLEKIFQIPFALAPMGHVGFGRLVRSVMTDRTDDAPPAAPIPDDIPAADSTTPPEFVVPAVEPPVLVSLEEAPETDEPATIVEEMPISTIDPNPPALRISADEVDFMSGLWEACRTPRAAKLLVNVYRLIRASRGENLVGYVENREYELVLVLLALLVGYPAQAPAIYQRLAGGATGSWSTFVTGMKPKGETPRFSNDFVDGFDRAAADEWRRLHEWLLGIEMTAGSADNVAAYAHWARRLARFSFETANVPAITTRAEKARRAPA